MAVPQGETFRVAGVDLYAYPDQVQQIGGFEVPENPEVEYEAWRSTRKIPQTNVNAPGVKITQMFGVFVNPIKWVAFWLGPNALARSLAFISQLQAQESITLLLGQRTYTGPLVRYKEIHRSRQELGYEIEMEVHADLSGGLSSSSSILTAAQQLTEQYTTITGLQANIPNDDVRAAIVNGDLTTLLPMIAAAQPESSAPTSSLLAIATQISTTIGDAQTLQTLVANSTLSGDVSLWQWAGALLSALWAYQATLGTVTGASGDTQQAFPMGTDLMDVASGLYGDWTRWTDIAQINGLSDPILATAAILLIPPARQITGSAAA